MKNILFVFLTLISSAIHAQTYLAEQFNYGLTGNILCGGSGATTNWVPYLNAGSTPVLYQAINLTYSGYSTVASGSGSMIFTNGSGTRECVNTAVPAISSGNVYFSFLMRVASGGLSSLGTPSDYCLYFNDTFGTSLSSTTAGMLFLKSGGLVPGFKLGLSKSSGTSGAVFTTANYAFSTTYLVVMKYMFDTASSTDDSVYAWIFSSGVPAVEPAPLLVATDMTVSDISRIRSVCVRQASGISYPVSVDEMRLGTSWGNTVLPVNFLDLSAILQNENDVLLKWSTASEINNDHFEIERNLSSALSTDNSWISVGKVPGNGNTNSVNNYHFSDDISNIRLLTSNIYYRIKQTDFDGKYSYSKTVSIELNKNEKDISVSPNPFTDEIILTYHLKSSKTIHVSLFDLLGKKIYSENIQLSSTNSQTTLKLPDLPSSIYLLKIDDAVYKMKKE